MLNAPAQAMGQERFEDVLKILDGSLQSADLPGKIHVENTGKDIKLSRK